MSLPTSHLNCNDISSAILVADPFLQFQGSVLAQKGGMEAGPILIHKYLKYVFCILTLQFKEFNKKPFQKTKPQFLSSFSTCAYQHLMWTAEQQPDKEGSKEKFPFKILTCQWMLFSFQRKYYAWFKYFFLLIVVTLVCLHFKS